VSGDDITPTGVGLVGCGNISDRYLAGMARFPQLRIAGCADVDLARARRTAEEHRIPLFATVDEMLASDDVELVVNITPPQAHAAVSNAALAVGKDVYVEKPLAATLDEATAMLALARDRGQLIGCAPDTFLGSAIQTARAAIDAGVIGDPLGAACFVAHSHAEEWHPDPRFLFQAGGGPLLDLGPYYVTALVNLLGPVAQVAGLTRIGATPRVMSAPDRLIEAFEVEVATHTTAAVHFASGVVGTMLMSFDIWHEDYPHIEIYGTAGALRLPDPNYYDGDVIVRGNTEPEWRLVEPVLPVSGRIDTSDQMLRGIGVADLVAARASGPHRASGALAYHVLEVLDAVGTSSVEQRFVPIQSTVDRSEPLTADSPLMPWAATAALPVSEVPAT
jgi:predicted dehydrogenase